MKRLYREGAGESSLLPLEEKYKEQRSFFVVLLTSSWRHRIRGGSTKRAWHCGRGRSVDANGFAGGLRKLLLNQNTKHWKPGRGRYPKMKDALCRRRMRLEVFTICGVG